MNGRGSIAIAVLAGGFAAALHVGKLPPALPLLQESLGLSLPQAGLLLSFVQLAGMLLGLPAGLTVGRVGPRRSMLMGLACLSIASALGAQAHSAVALVCLRALEGIGFLFAALPAPALLRKHVSMGRLPLALGLWGAYMPLGTAAALAAGPGFIDAAGWPAWWRLLSGASLTAAIAVWRFVPGDGAAAKPSSKVAMRTDIALTLRAPGPWMVALCFSMYSGQWLAVVGFLPTIYSQSGWSANTIGLLTSMAALVNAVGNIAAGPLLARGAAPLVVIAAGFIGMACGAGLAFNDIAAVNTATRYLGIVLFSMLGGMVPATLFTLAVRVAPAPHTVSATVGWVQQWSAAGQLIGPPLVAAIAMSAGGWHRTWVVTGCCCAVGIALAFALAQARNQDT